MLKHRLLLLCIFLTAGLQAQNYLCGDYSISQFRSPSTIASAPGLSGKLNRVEGNYAGISYHIACDRRNFLLIGAGISDIRYQKKWEGIFTESNQFGTAEVNGKIAYWSFPLSYSRILGVSRVSGCIRRYSRSSPPSRVRFGITISYTPSFIAWSSQSYSGAGGADLAFLTSLRSDGQSFQHSLSVGLSDQFYILERSLRLDLEPYIGIGSGFFKEGLGRINTTSFGLKVRLALHANIPEIRVEREVNHSNEAEKKKLLEQKQKEIEQQLKNQQPK